MKSQNISTYYKTRVVRQCRQMVDIWHNVYQRHSGRQIGNRIQGPEKDSFDYNSISTNTPIQFNGGKQDLFKKK